MREIPGKAKTARELLERIKYPIDCYRRECKWHEKQIRELVDDLSNKFPEGYQPSHQRSKVADYWLIAERIWNPAELLKRGEA